MLTVPSRSDVSDYKNLKKETDELVGRDGILQKRVEKSAAEKIIMDAREIYLNS